MLEGKNVVIIKGDKNTPAVVTEYNRVYLEYGPGDPLEDFTKTSEGKTLQVDGKDWTGQKPANAKSTVSSADRLEQALNYFATTYPSADKYDTLLEAASYGADLWKRNEIQSATRPSKPADPAVVINKMAKLIMSVNPGMTLETATTMANAMKAQS